MRIIRARAGRLLATGGALLALGAVSPGTAAAAPYTCDASAVRATLFGQATAEPVVTGRGAPCATRTAGGTEVVPALANASALSAATTLIGAGGPQRDQTAVASGGVSRLRIASLPSIGLGPALAQALAPVRTAVAALPAELVVTLPGLVGTPGTEVARVDVRGFATALLDTLDDLPATELLALEAARSTVAARCAGGVATPVGGAQASGLRVLGQELPTDTASVRTLQLLAGGTIDPSTLTDDDRVLGRYVTGLGTLDLTALKPLLQPLLDALPAIGVPAQTAEVRVTPARQQRTGAALTQRALRVEVAALGRSVLDLTVGEARVGADGVDCSAPQQEVMGATASDLALACTTRRLVLIDVVPSASGRRVTLFGAADRRYAGRRVDVVFEATGRRVARAKVRRDGSFRTTAPMPARAVRGTNRARYQARIGRQRSLNLKLMRRMRVTSITARDGRVRIRGRVLRPLADPVQRIVVRRRVSCRRTQVVGRFRPRADGRFDIRVRAPRGVTAAVYRLSTSVRRTTRNPKRFPTFTLPRAIDLLR